MRWLLIPTFILFLLPPAFAQDTPPSPPPPDTTPTARKLDSLQTIADPLAASLENLEKLKSDLAQSATEEAGEEIQARIDEERERIRKLRENFREILGGSEAAEYEEVAIESAGIQEQISELVQPILSEIREATSEPRELDALRHQLEIEKEKKRKADVVLERIDALAQANPSPLLSGELDSARSIWAGRQADAISRIAVLSVQIDERTRDRRSVWETISTGLSNFFKSRGMNLLFAVLAGVLGFFITRRIYIWIRHISPVHRRAGNNFASRISDVIAMVIAVIVAIAGIILVFYIRGDWLLLTLVIIFLLGVAWAGKTAIPPYLEQIRMILNLGSVREHERVIYNGLPWEVSKLGFYTTFTNPRLQGGQIRVPIRDVMPMVSRPVAPKEVWFPCEEDDWMVLSDGTYGKSITQTPEQVVILQLGGSMKTFPTTDFLGLSPENLSHGFRVTTVFGIDYKHQPESTTRIPETLKIILLAELISKYSREAVHSIQVELSAAAASSLDYTILADFDGSVAHRYKALERHLQTICVDTCNKHNWEIPFTQITIHQAET